MLSPDLQRISRIREYCVIIQQTVSRYGKDLDSFLSDTDYQHSVAFSLLQIGELAGGLSEAFRCDTAKQMPWVAMKGMRNVVAHDYGSVNRERMWATVTGDIPALKQFCDEQLSAAEHSEEP